MRPRRALSKTCRERLDVWCRAPCPCALEDWQFLAGLFVVVEEEIAEVLGEERRRLLNRLLEPSEQ